MMDKKKLAIVGANAAITMLIDKAKSLGYETHVFAWQCGDPGEKAADHFYPISIDKKDEIAEKCREIGVVGVCSITSDFAAPTVSYVARKLGLPSNPEITGEVARNKYKMRCAFKEVGLYTPPFIQLGKEYTKEDISAMQYPVIVKPTDRWSSKGVTRVDREEDLDSAVKYAIEESFDKHAIVEGFMDGQEYSAECICFNGKRRILAFTQKETTGFPHYIESGHFQPANLSEENKKKATDVILRALDALHIENSAAHAEFRVLSNGEIGIIEIGARMGGDCIGTDLTPISTGMDYIRMVIDVACGKAPDYTIVTEPSNVRIKFIMCKDDLEELNKLQGSSPESIVRIAELDGKFDREVVDSSTRHGYYIIKMRA
jgi:biotin carboxylase